MKILDNTAINFIFDSNTILSKNEIFYTTDDLQSEAELTSFIKNKPLPKNLENISKSVFFDEINYYKNYKEMLNKYGNRSFSNMTGFGDISILATIKTVLEKIKNIPRLPIPGLGENIEIFVSDGSLKKKIATEFLGEIIVIIKNPANLQIMH